MNCLLQQKEVDELKRRRNAPERQLQANRGAWRKMSEVNVADGKLAIYGAYRMPKLVPSEKHQVNSSRKFGNGKVARDPILLSCLLF